jgi:epoxyqueuosine reductase
MLTSESVKRIALAAGADLCGIGSMDRFEGAPHDMDPRHIFPAATSIIGLGFRIPRGVQRGIEEGTQFYQYPSMAYGGINEVFAPSVLYEVGRFIEDSGWEAAVYRNTGARGRVSDMDGSEGNTLSPEEQIDIGRTANKTAHHRSVQYTRPVAPSRAAPDLQFHFRIAAVVCGLGEIGWSKMLLTPQFGPMQRFAYIFTDAPLEPDPLYDGPPLCKRCMACARECPGSCISQTESITVTVAGKKLEWGKNDAWKCYAFYTHGGRYQNPFVPKAVFDENRDGALDVLEGKAEANEREILKVYNALEDYFPSWLGYNMAKCGGCIRACVNMLEKKGGCLKGAFREPLRTGKRWVLDR